MHNFVGKNQHATNWANIGSQANELASTNHIEIWMDKFQNVNIPDSPQIVMNCLKVEPYNINLEYVVTNTCKYVNHSWFTQC